MHYRLKAPVPNDSLQTSGGQESSWEAEMRGGGMLMNNSSPGCGDARDAAARTELKCTPR